MGRNIKPFILKTSDRDRVTSAIEHNIYNIFSVIAEKGGGSLYNGSNIKWIKAAPSVWPNYLFDAHFRDPQLLIDFIKNKVKSGTAPSQWFLGPGSNTTELLKAMIKGGFVRIGRWPGMAVEIENAVSQFTTPDGLSVEEVSGSSGLAQFEQVVSTAMFGGGHLGIDLIRGLYGDENIHMYLAFLEGKPVATSLLFTSAGIAGIYLVSTLPEHRNQGIGKKITVVPLLGAKQQGYKIGGLFATDLGEKIYTKLGFKKYCDFDIYYL